MNFKANAGTNADSSRGSRTFFNSERERWQAEYQRRLRLTDTVVVLGAVTLGQFVRFGPEQPIADSEYTVVSVLIAAVWLALLSCMNTRAPAVIGSGAEEYGRIISATMRLFGMIAIVSLLAQIDIARGYLAVAFPVGLVLLLLSRLAWRKHAVRKRRSGSYQTSVLVVGARQAARAMTTSFAREQSTGYRVVGVCTPGGAGADDQSMAVSGDEVPIVGDEHSVLDAVRLTGADTVVITATEQLGNDRIRDLVWELEPLGVDLVVTPGIVDVAGQRLEIRPVADMPLLHIGKPQYDGATSFGKQAFDFCFALFALVAIAPVLLAIAIVVKATSSGPVLYRSERMGIDGTPFEMIKFRSMFVDADRHLDALVQQNEGAGVLFKMRDDPRVTPIGKIIRKYSLDELPQFINVLRGEMSIVGPRPPLRREVEAYDGMVRRRLLVKPGVTGLWQVSGRSDLSWEESVRLDISYVENWSMVQDLLIIKKTLSAVAKSDGAY